MVVGNSEHRITYWGPNCVASVFEYNSLISNMFHKLWIYHKSTPTCSSSVNPDKT